MVFIQEKDYEDLSFSASGSTYDNSPYSDAHPPPPTPPTPFEPMDLTQLHEFENVRGDLFLVSSTNDTFRVTGAIIFEVSPFLKKVIDNGRMRFNLASTDRISHQADLNDQFTSMVSFQDNNTQLPILTFPDIDTTALILVLNTIYPVSHRQTLSTLPAVDFQLISSLLKAGTKYQIPLIVKTARQGLHPTAGPTQIGFYKSSPNTLKAFVFARTNGLKEETLLAAHEMLKFPHPLIVPGEYIPELENLTAGDYHRLADYHSRVSRKIQELFTLPEPIINAQHIVQVPDFRAGVESGFTRFQVRPSSPLQWLTQEPPSGPFQHPLTWENATLHSLRPNVTGNIQANPGVMFPGQQTTMSTTGSNNIQGTTAVNEAGATQIKEEDISIFKRFPSLVGCSNCVGYVKQWETKRPGGTASRSRCHPYANAIPYTNAPDNANAHYHAAMHSIYRQRLASAVGTSRNGQNSRGNPQTPPTRPANWWATYVDHVVPVISQSPLTDTIFSMGFLQETVVAMIDCAECSGTNDAFRNLDEVVSLIRKEREKLVKEVLLDLPW